MDIVLRCPFSLFFIELIKRRIITNYPTFENHSLCIRLWAMTLKLKYTCILQRLAQDSLIAFLTVLKTVRAA